MKNNKGCILSNAIKNIDDLRGRCVIDEETGCWNYPAKDRSRIYVRLPGSEKGIVMDGPRAALSILNGVDTKPAFRVKCNNPKCCNPDHCRQMSHVKYGELVAKKGWLKGDPARAVRATISRRKRASLNEELVREIKLSDENNSVISRRLSISRSTIRQVRSGKIWRDVSVVNSSVFNWRP